MICRRIEGWHSRANGSQLISTLWAPISMAYKSEIKLDKRYKGSSSKTHTWDKSFTSYQWKNYDSKQGQSSNSTWSEEDQPQKTNQSLRNQEIFKIEDPTPIKDWILPCVTVAAKKVFVQWMSQNKNNSMCWRWGNQEKEIAQNFVEDINELKPDKGDQLSCVVQRLLLTPKT